MGRLHRRGLIAHIHHLQACQLGEQLLRRRRRPHQRQRSRLLGHQLLGHRQPAPQAAGIVGPHLGLQQGLGRLPPPAQQALQGLVGAGVVALLHMQAAQGLQGRRTLHPGQLLALLPEGLIQVLTAQGGQGGLQGGWRRQQRLQHRQLGGLQLDQQAVLPIEGRQGLELLREPPLPGRRQVGQPLKRRRRQAQPGAPGRLQRRHQGRGRRLGPAAPRQVPHKVVEGVFDGLEAVTFRLAGRLGNQQRCQIELQGAGRDARLQQHQLGHGILERNRSLQGWLHIRAARLRLRRRSVRQQGRQLRRQQLQGQTGARQSFTQVLLRTLLRREQRDQVEQLRQLGRLRVLPLRGQNPAHLRLQLLASQLQHPGWSRLQQHLQAQQQHDRPTADLPGFRWLPLAKQVETAGGPVLHQLLLKHRQPGGGLKGQLATQVQPLGQLPAQLGPQGGHQRCGALAVHRPMHRRREPRQQLAVAAPEGLGLLRQHLHQPRHQLQQGVVVLHRRQPLARAPGVLAAAQVQLSLLGHQLHLGLARGGAGLQLP